MDVIEYKLASDNPILVSHAIWKLLEAVERNVKSHETESKTMSQLPELKTLLTQCQSTNGAVSITACQAIVVLAANGVIAIPATISNLTACLAGAKHYGAIASAICNLLTLDLKIRKSENEYVCPFSLTTPRHPLITILMEKNDAWRDVSSHVKSMMNHCEAGLVERHASLLRPVFLFLLCDPKLSRSEDCRQRYWHLLTTARGTANLQVEVLQWLRTNSLESCIDTNNRILELAERAVAKKDKSLCSALLPLTMSMALKLLKHDRDPRTNLDIVSLLLAHADAGIGGGLFVSFLAAMISTTPSAYLLDIVTMASTILDERSCNGIIAHSLIGSILQWMAYPSILCADALDVAKLLIIKINNGTLPKRSGESSDELYYTVKPFDRLLYADTGVQFYTELCILVDSLNEENIIPWLDKLSKAPICAIKCYKLTVGGIFLESKKSRIIVKACEILVACANHGDNQVLSLLLYKLANTNNIRQTRHLLFALPQLTATKENVPIIMHAFKAFSSAGKPLSHLAVELYVKSMAVEPRCHRYLHAALVELSATDRSWQSEVTCARAMRYICENYSEHGAELVPLLSQTLNRCCSDKSTSAAASALALKGISALCVAGVTEITSTWRALAPKINTEHRSIVLRALCELFGDIPRVQPQEGQHYDELLVEVLTKLWQYALTTNDPELIAAAFKALSEHRLETMPLCVLPPDLRSRVHVRRDISDEDTDDKCQNLLPYIPGNYLIAMLQSVDRASLEAAGNFFKNCIQEELGSFRTSLYRWPNSEPVNYKYLPEKSPLRAIGEYARHYKAGAAACDGDGDGNGNDAAEKRAITTECLRILSHKFLIKPLPPIHWKYLQNAIAISEVTQRYGISLACHQAQISVSAKEFLEKHLTIVTDECRSAAASPPDQRRFGQFLDLYKKLDDICRAVGTNVLAPFLDATLNVILDKASRDNESAFGMFDEAMRGIGKALNDQFIHNDNRSVLTGVLEKLMDRIDADNKIFACYVNAAMEMTAEQVERMTLPSVWLNVTTAKLKKAIIIRAQLVLVKNDSAPLSWMNEIIRASATTTAVHSCLFEQLQRIVPQIRLEKSNPQWSLDLMRRIGAMVDNKEEKNIDTATFLCDILFITIICCSATDCLLISDQTLVKSRDARAKLFPQAAGSIVQMAHWKDIAFQTMEWSNHMRTTPIPEMYKIVFNDTLLALKNQVYFDATWTKYLSTGAPIHL